MATNDDTDHIDRANAAFLHGQPIDPTAILVCMPAEPGYVPPVPSAQTHCTSCGKNVWRSLRSPTWLRPMCAPCAVQLAKGSTAPDA